MDEKRMNDAYYKDFLPGIHKSAISIMAILFVVTVLPAVYLSFIKGYHPGWDVLAKAAVAMIGIEAIQWIAGPPIVFPMVGAMGSYISYYSGNGMSMRLPACRGAQAAVDAKQGTRKANFAGAFGMAASVYVNLAFLVCLVILSDWILGILPPVVIDSTQYVLASVYGALFVTFIMQSNWKGVLIAAPLGIVLMLAGIPKDMQMIAAVVISAIGCFAAGKVIKSRKQAKAAVEAEKEE